MANGAYGLDDIQLAMPREIILTYGKTLKFRLAITDKRWCY
jgi:hypothetical protein